MGGGEPTRGTPGGRDVDLLRAMAARIDQHDPGAFNNLGVLYHSKGLFADAVDAFLRALTLDPRMRIAARNLEVAAGKPGACDARLAELDARLHANDEDHAARRERARLFRLIGRTTDATQQLDALIAEDPDDAASLFERGLVEQRNGDLRRAQRWFERAVNAAVDGTVARVHLAEVLYQRGQNEQALDALDAAIAQDPTLADAHLLRGFVLGDMGRHDAAIAAARQASTLNPALQSIQAHLSLSTGPEALPEADPGDGALVRYSLGLAFRQRGYFDESRREFVRAIEQGEDERLARHAMAELDLIDGHFDSALAAYEQLLREMPDHPRYWNEQGVALHQRGDVAAAAESYRHALRWDPRYALAYNNLGVALSDLGDANAARESLVRAGELDPTLARAKLNLARWYRQHGDPLASLALLREMVAFHPGDADAWHELGVAHRDVQQTEEARDAFARAIECRPEHAEARYGLAHALGILGDPDGALRETQKALALSPVRANARLSVIIDLQRECPDACGTLELLSLRHGDPLQGVALNAGDVASLLPEQAVAVTAAPTVDPLADAARALDEADTFAARGVHGEALERYVRARETMEASSPLVASPDMTAPEYRVWRRAAIGESRSQCLLAHGDRALALLKTLGQHDGQDAEVLALFACSAAALAAASPAAPSDESVAPSLSASPAETARQAIVRLLRLEPPSAAIMHFVGDAAMSIGDPGLALACYRRALAIDPARPSPRVAIARLLRARGDVLAARLELVAALSSMPGLREAVLELAQVHRDADRPNDALALLREHLERTPTDLDALMLLAETLVRLDRDADARIAVARVLRHDSEHLSALWLDGVLLARQARLRDAIDRWRRVAVNDANAKLADHARQAIARAESPALRLVS